VSATGGDRENQPKYKENISFSSKKPFWAVFCLFSSLFFPISVVHAGVVSDIVGAVANIFQPVAQEEDIPLQTSKNSQNMALAEAPLNHDLNQKKKEISIEVVDDSALSAELASSLGGDDTVVASGDQISVYVVRPGDTLSQIAKMFGVSTNTVLWANDIPKGGSIKVGQELVILPVSGIQYVVKKGDTVAKIAKKYNVEAEEIESFNEIDGALVVGDEIIIPNGIETPAPTVSPVKKFFSSIISPQTSTSGYFTRPVPGARTQGLHGHNGIDFRAAVGTPVVSAAEGTITLARSGGYNSGYGSYVVIKHPNGTQTLYAHLSAVYVATGAEVRRGQTIGLSGNTGRSTGPHLHFEVRGGTNPF